MINNPEILSLDRPLLYSGEAILTKSKETLQKFRKNNIDNIDEKTVTWLHRLESVIRRDVIYKVSIQEAVDIGFIY